MLISIAIMTSPRPRPTLSLSVRSLRNAGFPDRVLVFAEPGVPPLVSEGVEFLPNETKLGNLRNWVRALSCLLKDPEGKWLMVCEDDIVWAKDSYAALERDLPSLIHTHEFKRSGCISLYLPRQHYKKFTTALKDGWHSSGLQHGNKTWGAQCYLFSRPQAQYLLEDPQFKSIVADMSLDKNIDAHVGKCINDRSNNILYRVPCLVNHSLGENNSSMGYKENRINLKTDYFRGYP